MCFEIIFRESGKKVTVLLPRISALLMNGGKHKTFNCFACWGEQDEDRIHYSIGIRLVKLNNLIENKPMALPHGSTSQSLQLWWTSIGMCFEIIFRESGKKVTVLLPRISALLMNGGKHKTFNCFACWGEQDEDRIHYSIGIRLVKLNNLIENKPMNTRWSRCFALSIASCLNCVKPTMLFKVIATTAVGRAGLELWNVEIEEWGSDQSNCNLV